MKEGHPASSERKGLRVAWERGLRHRAILGAKSLKEASWETMQEDIEAGSTGRASIATQTL